MENLTRAEAIDRATRIGHVTTDVALELGAEPDAFASTTRLTFVVDEPGHVFVDLTAAEVLEARLDDRPLDPAAVQPSRLRLGALTEGRHELYVAARMHYQRQGKGLHRFVDPTDGAVYLHSQFEPYDAHLVFACFDQPDLKTVFSLQVDAPAGWVVVSNGQALQHPADGGAGRWRFAPTPPVSPYVTAVVAGPYVRFEDHHRREDGSRVELGWYARSSLAEHVDADELFDVTRRGLAAFEQLFDQPYPFGDRYDQLFVPEFHAGAMENPGCVTFSENYVFRSRVTEAMRERRAETILHEMAHMWFGDLVTMRWWDDLWLNESFATFMAVLVQATSTRWTGAWTTFLDAEKAWAKLQDQLPSTHPVADEMPDVVSVHQNFDGITYAKGAAVLRQLVAWVGQGAFLAGCRAYFATHAWHNATLADFLAALEEASGRDLAGWRDEWLLTTGVNQLRADTESVDGRYTSFAIEQSAPPPPWTDVPGVGAPEPVLRRHRVAVGLYHRTGAGLVRGQRVEVDVTGARTPVPELVGEPTADAVLVNDDDLTYTKVALDPATTRTLTRQLSALADPLPRALAWSIAWDMVRDGLLPVGAFVELVERHVAREAEIGVLQRLLARAAGGSERYGDPERLSARLASLARGARRALEEVEPASDHQLAWVRHWASVARGSAEELRAVERVLDGDELFVGLHVDTDLRWDLVVALSRAGVLDEQRLLAELERDPTDVGERRAATARAARPTRQDKQEAYERLLGDEELSHAMARAIIAGFAQLDQRDALREFTARYFDVLDEVFDTRPLEWAIQFAAGTFPHWDAGPELIERVDDVLRRDAIGAPARRVLLEQRDTLTRTVRARQVDAHRA